LGVILLKFRKNDILSFIIGVDEEINLPGFGVDEDVNLPGSGVDGDVNLPGNLYFQATFTSFVSGLVCFLQVKKQQTKEIISKKRV